MSVHTTAFIYVIETFEAVVAEMKECKVHFSATDAVELTKIILARDDKEGEGQAK